MAGRTDTEPRVPCLQEAPGNWGWGFALKRDLLALLGWLMTTLRLFDHFLGAVLLLVLLLPPACPVWALANLFDEARFRFLLLLIGGSSLESGRCLVGWGTRNAESVERREAMASDGDELAPRFDAPRFEGCLPARRDVSSHQRVGVDGHGAGDVMAVVRLRHGQGAADRAVMRVTRDRSMPRTLSERVRVLGR